MRLKEFINESYELDELNDLIHRNCKPYLSLIGTHKPIMRGMEYVDDDLGIKNVRKDRRPLGMQKADANILNDWLEKNGHCRRDRSVLCSYNDSNVSNFGVVYYIFPIGSFRYSWVESRDINGSYSATGWDGNSVEAWIDSQSGEPSKISKSILSRMKIPFEKYFHTDEGFSEMMNNRYECWIECKQYYNAIMSLYSWEDKRLVKDEDI
jgi:hypothetical protein